MTTKARMILKETFGYDGFRPFQEEIILSVLNKRDTLVLMPTGGGKSICYQVPALLFDGLTVVVSPLISLMKDQVDQLRELGIPVVMLNSSLDLDVYHNNIRLIRENRVKLLYVAPETLLKPDIIRLLLSTKIDCVAIDEAHCISEWGHDFRPEYRQLAGLRVRFSEAAWMALTATATKRVQSDIIDNLGFTGTNSFIASFNRENLFFQVLPKQNSFRQLLEFLKKFPEKSGIIYCFSRNGVDALAVRLAEYGYSVRPYHAGLADERRRENQELFIRDEVQIIVATIAFGMGIHKSNIRFVVHYDLPKSIESYYQETGRAGRDGLQAHCLLLYSYTDIHKIRYFIDQKESETERNTALLHLNALVEYAETDRCRRIPLIRYFGEDYREEQCGMCDNCTNTHNSMIDVTVFAQQFLSCVMRVHEKFGINHIVDILRGSESEKILKFNHQKLSTYGIGKELSKKQWQHLARQLIRKGIIKQDTEDFGTIKLMPGADDVLRGAITVAANLPDEKKDRNEITENGEIEYDRELFELLRLKRKELADTANVPAYIIFSDRSLTEMATSYPQHKSSMLDIHGVGAHKYEKYGEEFFTIIRSYCGTKNIEEKIKNDGSKKIGYAYKYKIIGDLYNSGRSIHQIMNENNIKLSTVLNHLYDYIINGFMIYPDGVAEYIQSHKDDEKAIFEAFDRLGAERLKPVFEAFDGRIDYDTLSAYRLYYFCKR
jgi:ATP-dependent DNA helicase RecQ